MGDTQLSTVGYNKLDGLAIILDDYPGPGPAMPPDGRYELFLHPPAGVGSPSLVLEQDGIIPSWATTLTYQYLGTRLDLTINGQNVPALFSFPGPPGTLERASYDIAKFQGQEVTLTLSTAPPSIFQFQGPFVTLDSIALIPEPSPVHLILLAAFGWGLRWVACQKRGPAKANQTLETNCRPAAPLYARRQFGRAAHAPTCVSDGSRSAFRSIT